MRERLRTQRAPAMRLCLAVLALGWCAVGECGAALADSVPYTVRSTFGEVGILDMPSARMAPDGELSGTIGFLKSTQRYNFAFQLLPWLEGSFRYSRIARFNGAEALYDRSFGLKVRLVNEDDTWPTIALGFRDLLGTGVYGAEYLVASKRFGDFDVSTGLGWGRLASVDTFPNPFGLIWASFKNRPPFGTTATGGTVNFGQFFHGPAMGLFGGVIWHTPVDDLDLLVEYSSDRYVQESASGAFKVRMPVNVGAAYRVFNIATVSAGWYYGTSYGVTVTFNTDPTMPVSPQKFGPEIAPPVIRPAKQQIDALAQLLTRSRPLDRAIPARPWVQLPQPQADSDVATITSALMSYGPGVQDVDVSGRTLLIDAALGKTGKLPCDGYAKIVSALAPRLETIALTNLDDRSGKVAICTIAHRASLLSDESPDAATAPAAAPAGGPPDLDPAAATRKIRDDVEAQSLVVEALSVEPEMVWIYFSNSHYASEAAAAGRIARVLMADAPASAEVFHIVSVRNGMQLLDFQVARSALERATLAYGTTSELSGAVSIAAAPLSNPVLERAWDEAYPRIHWSIGPGMRSGFFDPDVPVQVQILAAANASIDITPKLTLEGRAEFNIYNNYDLVRLSNSQLPHVRSDLNLYNKFGINGIANLDAVYRTRVSRDVYFEARAGYLEDMFAGAGVQMLWRPEGERFALGIDLYQVWQRDFDRLFGLQQYHVLTGHASAYYQSPWYGLNFAVHAGRYLAGDYGATIEVTRQFSTGVEIGAFATFTNVPFAKFGEGSFDKGIIIHIPLEWALPFNTQSVYDIRLRSLVRDGGQRLDDDDSLFAETRPTSYGEVIGHIDEVVAP